MKSNFLDAIQNGTLLLDGAYGTNLQPLGMAGCPERWVLEHPESLKQLYQAYLDAGSRVLLAFTFGCNPIKLAEYGLSEYTEEFNAELVRLAKSVAGDRAFVGGDIAPCGQFVQPVGDLSFEAAVDCFKRQIRAIAAAGADYLHVETMLDLQEVRAALLAAKEVCDLPVVTTLTYQPGGRTLTGTHPVSALLTLQGMGAAAVGLNCSTGPEDMLPLLRAMRPYAQVPLAVKPNAGLPDAEGAFRMGPEAFAAATAALGREGATLLGGCCGTTPEHIAALRAALEVQKPATAGYPGLTLCSAGAFHAVGDCLTVVGERINPTGKKALSADLAAGRLDVALAFAKQQREAGAHVLDVNVAAPGVDETDMLPKAVCAITARCPLPLCIDTASQAAAEAALRVYPGRALLNSVPIGKAGYEARLATLHKYGAAALLLPLGDALPKTARERICLIDAAVQRALDLGMRLSDLAVDGLTLTVSTDPGAPRETLAVLEYCKSIGVATILGVSNVSFGLPARPVLGAAFLQMAAYAGLSMAIVNPNAEAMANAVAAADLLLGQDAAAKRYVARMAPPEEAVDAPALPPLSRAVQEGEVTGICALVESELRARAPMAVLQEDILPALDAVGDGFEHGRLFLPQLMRAADAVQAAFTVLLPALQTTGGATERGKVVMATVQGDIHDIGKNIVCTMLRSYGYQVIDLGKDVPSKVILDEAARGEADIIGLSALLSTTLPAMSEVIEGAKARKLHCKVMVGGAAVTPEYAKRIGADGYSADANAAVALADRLLGR